MYWFTIKDKQKSITSKVELDDFQIGDDDWRFGGRFFVVVVPFATKTFSFVPDFNQLLVVLDDHRVFVEFAFSVRFGSATVVDDGKSEIIASRFRLDVDAIILAELSFGKDQTGKWFIERQLNFHMVLGAHHFQVLNLRHIGRSLLLPRFLADGILTLTDLTKNIWRYIMISQSVFSRLKNVNQQKREREREKNK